MKVPLLTFLSILFWIPLLNAQEYTQTVRGKVFDEDSKRPLVGVNVGIFPEDTAFGASTDEEGRFRIEGVPVGRHDVHVKYIGYEDKVLPNIVVTSGKEVILEVALQEKVHETEEVTIEGNKKGEALNSMSSVSSRRFNVEETNRYAGSRADPSRMAANYAGVNAANDARNDIIVRGNSPLGVLWRLEDFDIPSPNHFSTQGATGGPVSILNNNLLKSSDFMTGAFPAEYGNRNAAVFDLRMRNGNDREREYVGQVGINGFELGAEGPISKEQGSSYLANYRYSTLDLFHLLGIDFGVSGVPRYQDLSFKLNMPTEKLGRFSLFGIGGKSDIEILDSERDEEDWTFTGKGEDLRYGSDMGATGISNTHFFDENTSGKAGISVAASRQRIELDTFPPSSPEDKFRTYENHSVEGRYSAFYRIDHKFNAQHKVRAGVRYKEMFFDYNEEAYSRRLGRFVHPLKESDHSGLFQSHLQWQFRPDDRWTVNSGAYYQQFRLNGSQALDPRFGVNWELRPGQELGFGYGLHSQTQPLFIYFEEFYDPRRDRYFRSNEDLGFSRSHHFVLSYDRTLGEQFRLKSETYFQRLFDVPVQGNESSHWSMLNAGAEFEGVQARDSLSNEGTGKNYGLELTLEKFFGDRYYFLITGTLYESKYEGSDGVERNTRFNGNYIANVLGGVELPLGNENRTVSLDLRVANAGGNRYVPIDLEASRNAGEAVYDGDRAFEERLKDYSRVDLKLSFRMNHEKATQNFFVTVENIFGRKNVLQRVYVPESGEVKTDYQLGLFPYGGYRVRF